MIANRRVILAHFRGIFRAHKIPVRGVLEDHLLGATTVPKRSEAWNQEER